MNWLTKNDDGTYTKDESTFKSKLNEFVKSLASQYNSIGSSRTFIIFFANIFEFVASTR